MNIYVKTQNNEIIAIRGSSVKVKRLPNVVSGLWKILPADKHLRSSAYYGAISTWKLLDGNKLWRL